ncbi:UNVERIFIED_CONTAM: hypothetical protein ABID98_000437 [Brevibacillus sp. OAP136]
MRNMVVIGKGAHFDAVFAGLTREHPVRQVEWEERAYLLYLHMEGGKQLAKGVLVASLCEMRRMESILRLYDSVFLFIDELSEGLNIVAFFFQLQTCRIYVVTAKAWPSTLYKQLGAHYVIRHKKESFDHRWICRLTQACD